ncbi:MAG TPA: phosphohistidine phosphatase SixA [Candidatus Acidoferrum sp.]|nr:phosphohistidine phosphatase SixA [Candidatus Acidoferrum sp.]
MNLYLLRHGIAVEPGTAGYELDSERPLTAKGKNRLRAAARAMEALELSFDVILTSPYLRARQTAEIIAKDLGLRKRLAFCDELTPAGNPRLLIQQLNQIRPEPKNVLLVGHEPYLGKLIALLAAGNTSLEIDFKKGGLCKLETEFLLYGRCARLVWLLTPRQLEKLA